MAPQLKVLIRVYSLGVTIRRYVGATRENLHAPIFAPSRVRSRWDCSSGARRAGRSAADNEGCTPVTTRSLAIAGLVISGSKMQAAGDGLPKHCIVSGAVNERTGADGRTYAIHFEIRLPTEWNGRFLHQVNGGNNGAVLPRPATNRRLSPRAASGAGPRLCGFVVRQRPLRRRSGKQGAGSRQRRRVWPRSAGAAGLRLQRRHDAVADRQGDHRRPLRPKARLFLHVWLLERRAPHDGGGLAHAGKHDGFLVGDPGFDLPRAAIQHAWDAQAFTKADPDIRKSISKEDAALISRKIIQACDKLDGLEDGLTANLLACRRRSTRKPHLRSRRDGRLPARSQDQRAQDELRRPKNAKGEALYSDWPVDGGVGTGNWRLWKIESPIPPWHNYPIIATMGAASLEYIFTTPPTRVEGTNEALMKALLSFSFDTDAPKIFARTGAFPESAMDFMTPPGVDDPKLDAFRQNGRKMIIYHGQADPVFSIDDTIRWWEKLDANTGGKAADNVRLFAVPGMTHCEGGLALEKFDALTALTDWVRRARRRRRSSPRSIRPTRRSRPHGARPHPPALPLAEICEICRRRSGERRVVHMHGALRRIRL